MCDIDKQFSILKSGQLPAEIDIFRMCIKANEILAESPNVVHLAPPISVCGDIHGQFFDLLELFEAGGKCPDTSYCFLGDYVDRGYHSVETILYLIALKIKYPDHITLLRGNHESRSTTTFYTFYHECLVKFNSNKVHLYVMSVFDLLPLAAVIGQQYFAVHGGISPGINRIDDIMTIDRKMEIPSNGIMCDLMWSDPDETVCEWGISSRGAGFLYGELAVDKFHHANNTKCIFRGHQMVIMGYTYLFKNQTVCTVWSAPNYCYRCNNFGVIVEIDEFCELEYNIFQESNSPYRCVNKMAADNIDKNKYFC